MDKLVRLGFYEAYFYRCDVVVCIVDLVEEEEGEEVGGFGEGVVEEFEGVG